MSKGKAKSKAKEQVQEWDNDSWATQRG